MGDLADLQKRAADDLDAAQVLLDALLEGAYRDERVMMMCIGVPLDRRAPDHLGETGRRSWRIQRNDSIRFAQSHWDLYMGRADFARACHAVVIFGAWSLRGSTGASPWATCRAAGQNYQDRLANRRENRVRRERMKRGLVPDPTIYVDDEAEAPSMADNSSTSVTL